MSETKDWLNELVLTMARLRAADGCPWDREQTHQSLKRYLVEESAELLDAIDDGDDDRLADELGDVLLQVAFHAQIAAEAERFDLQDVARRLCAKLIRRHPHVFGDAEVNDAAGVVVKWEEIKKTERDDEPESVLGDIPKHLPALAQAEKIQRRAAKVGFDWAELKHLLPKLREELQELEVALHQEETAAVEAELGDLFFTIVNVCRFVDVDPEDALRRTNRKFRRRFAYVEDRVRSGDREFADCTLAELDEFWDEAKEREQ